MSWKYKKYTAFNIRFNAVSHPLRCKARINSKLGTSFLYFFDWLKFGEYFLFCLASKWHSRALTARRRARERRAKDYKFSPSLVKSVSDFLLLYLALAFKSQQTVSKCHLGNKQKYCILKFFNKKISLNKTRVR